MKHTGNLQGPLCFFGHRLNSMFAQVELPNSGFDAWFMPLFVHNLCRQMKKHSFLFVVAVSL